MSKTIGAFSVLVIGTLLVGICASAFYVLFTFSGKPDKYKKYYHNSPIKAVYVFVINPYKGDSIEDDDRYVRNVIFGFSLMFMGFLAYKNA